MILAESISNHPSVLWIHGMVWVYGLLICNCRWAIFPSPNRDVVKNHTCNYYITCPFWCDSQLLETLESCLQDPDRVFEFRPWLSSSYAPGCSAAVVLARDWHTGSEGKAGRGTLCHLKHDRRTLLRYR